MANNLVIFSAPKKHIDFMVKHPGVVSDYYVGEPPIPDEPEPVREKDSLLVRLLGKKPKLVETAPVVAPEDWPDSEAEAVDIEINHRNVDLYHWILNQTPNPVDGAGSIFQTWFYSTHSALPLDNYNENFAFEPHQLPELLELVQAVTPELLIDAYEGWCKANEVDHVPMLKEAKGMHRGFVNFENYLKVAISKQHGLVWVLS